MKMKNNKTLNSLITYFFLAFVIMTLIVVFTVVMSKEHKRITELEEKAFHPVVVERCEEYSDERTYELVQQAFDCEELESYKWFDYAYTVQFGKNDYGQDLIFVTFYYSKVNDPNDYKVTVCNYYVSPDVNKWEIVE